MCIRDSISFVPAAHHLGHVHCSYQGTLALAGGDKADVLGTDAQHDVLGSGIAGFQLFLNLLRQLYLGAGAVDVIPCLLYTSPVRKAELN